MHRISSGPMRQLAAPLRRGARAVRVGSVAVLAVGGCLAGCGSSSSSTSSTKSTTASPAATAAHTTPIRGVASPAGAAKPSPAALKKLVRVPKASGVAARIAGLSKLPLDQQLTSLDNDINTFWGKIFANSNIQWPQTQQALIQSSPVQTQCSERPTIAPTDPWFLCDPTFYWPLPWIQQNVLAKGGDVAVAFGVAIFWSFHVQNVLGFTQAMQKGQMSKGDWANQTLCLTGIWVRTLSQRNLFEQGDTQALQSLVTALQGVSGIGPPDVTQRSLTQAFLTGYNGGDPRQCTGGSGGGGGGQQTTPSTPSTTPTTTSPTGL